MTAQPTPHSIAYGKMLEREMAERESHRLKAIAQFELEIAKEQAQDRIIREDRNKQA